MIVVFSGPSGVGKSTIINLLKSEFEFYFSISHTTRPMREDEQNYTDYYFVSNEIFQEMVSKNEFIEYEKYGSYFYGTSKNEITKSSFTILDLEVNGATKLLSTNSDYKGIFIDIDDEILIERLNERGHNKEFIEERMKLASEQRKSIPKFHYVLKNIDLKTTLKEILDILYDLEKK
jgi:guanylate kinase